LAIRAKSSHLAVIRFDEGMNDLPPDLVSPNVVHLQRMQNGELLPAETEETSVDHFTFHLNPFSYTMMKGVQVTDDDPSYGLTLASDELNQRAYVTGVKENSTADKMYATHKLTLKNVKGAYLVGINGRRVFGKDDAISMLHQLYDERAENLQLEQAINASSPLLKHGAPLLSTTSWNPVPFLMLITSTNSCWPIFDASLQFVTHTLISPSPHSPPKKWKWSYKPSNLKLSLQLSKRLAASLDACFVP